MRSPELCIHCRQAPALVAFLSVVILFSALSRSLQAQSFFQPCIKWYYHNKNPLRHGATVVLCLISVTQRNQTVSWSHLIGSISYSLEKRQRKANSIREVEEQAKKAMLVLESGIVASRLGRPAYICCVRKVPKRNSRRWDHCGTTIGHQRVPLQNPDLSLCTFLDPICSYSSAHSHSRRFNVCHNWWYEKSRRFDVCQWWHEEQLRRFDAAKDGTRTRIIEEKRDSVPGLSVLQLKEDM